MSPQHNRFAIDPLLNCKSVMMCCLLGQHPSRMWLSGLTLSIQVVDAVPVTNGEICDGHTTKCAHSWALHYRAQDIQHEQCQSLCLYGRVFIIVFDALLNGIWLSLCARSKCCCCSLNMCIVIIFPLDTLIVHGAHFFIARSAFHAPSWRPSFSPFANVIHCGC